MLSWKENMERELQVDKGPWLVNNYWDSFRWSVVLPHQATLSHQVHILHEDTISLALANGNKAGLSIPSTG